MFSFWGSDRSMSSPENAINYDMKGYRSMVAESRRAFSREHLKMPKAITVFILI